MHWHMFIQQYVAKHLDAMHSGSVVSLMLAVFKLAKTLISANMYGMQSSCIVHRFLKRKVVIRTQDRRFGIKSMQ